MRCIRSIKIAAIRPVVQNLTPDQAASLDLVRRKDRAGNPIPGAWYVNRPKFGNLSEDETDHIQTLKNQVVAPEAAPEAAPQTAANPGEQMTLPFGDRPQGSNPADFIRRLRDGVNLFGKQFNVQTIRPYNNAIQHALKAVKSLEGMPDISPELEQSGNELLQLFQSIQASAAEDTQLVNQLGQLAQQLAVSAGAYQTTEPTTTEPTTAEPEAPSQNWWQRLRSGLPGGQPRQRPPRQVPWDAGVGQMGTT